MNKNVGNKHEEKARRERKIFAEFAEAAGLEVDFASIQSEVPPKPDISCTIAGKKHFFEMREITDQALARRYSIAINTGQQTGGWFSQDDPLVSTFSSKLEKDYGELDGVLEFLAYYEKQYPPPILKESTRQALFWTTQSMLFGKWRRIWIYSTWDKQVLCSYRLEDLIGITGSSVD